MKKVLGLLFCYFLVSTAFALECEFVAGKTICSVPLNADQSVFVESLGEPDGRLKMGVGREGLFYGQTLLLIFNKSKLWQVHAWNYNSNIDYWSYVRNVEDRNNLQLKIGGWSPWGETRNGSQQKLATFKVVAGDQFSEVREHPTGTMLFYYQPTFEVNSDPNDWQKYETAHIKISIH